MLIGLSELPKAVPMQRLRPPQENIPQTRFEREHIRAVISRFVHENRGRLAPPLILEELRSHTDAVVAAAGIDPKYRDYAGILLNNEVWREQLATVPYDRRLLLMPKCLRVEDKCPAPFDEFGLLCKQCGLCSIQDLQEEAEKLGYAVLVAEGSAIVMKLIETGKIEAIVGVSCLSVLERAFPYMEAAAVPGVAIPLLQDDCKDTTVDMEWVWDVIHLTSDDKTYRMDLDGLRKEVETWFAPAELDAIFGEPARDDTERLAREWLARAGKRWRPFLTVCAWRAFQQESDVAIPGDLRKLAVAVECFHKASLIHDDIEDADDERYGEQTLHSQHGVPVALNVGDLLIGEGYRLLAASDAPPEIKSQMIAIAAAGHRTLCLGQGAELSWALNPQPLPMMRVLDIFRNKTAPAFEVALRIGAAYAGAPEEVHSTLTRYSEALGIAYQIRDDVEDLAANHVPDDRGNLRPTLPMAIAYERAKGDDRAALAAGWQRQAQSRESDRRHAIITGTGAEERCRQLLEAYKEQAIRSLAQVQNPNLKGLLRRVVGKIFAVEIKGWCSEFETRNAAGSQARAQAT